AGDIAERRAATGVASGSMGSAKRARAAGGGISVAASAAGFGDHLDSASLAPRGLSVGGTWPRRGR
ncbi:MAG: hypothetical protein Q4B08_01510, partial [Propionibacteriaceae bacterium]|nr:hypothetical protein [Propionibacteriaceae bacterium]